MNEEQVSQLLGIALQVAGLAGAALLAYLAALLKRKFGIDIEAGKKVIEAGNRDALQMALATAATLAASRGIVGPAAIQFILDYVMRSSPEAASAAPQSVLQDKARAALETKAMEAVLQISKESGLDNLSDALKRAKAWTPPE